MSKVKYVFSTWFYDVNSNSITNYSIGNGIKNVAKLHVFSQNSRFFLEKYEKKANNL
jgi:hypothetical protein